MEYAKLLKAKLSDWPNLVIVMRAYLYVNSSSSMLSIDVLSFS
jgi:hypothetical protein